MPLTMNLSERIPSSRMPSSKSMLLLSANGMNLMYVPGFACFTTTESSSYALVCPTRDEKGQQGASWNWNWTQKIVQPCAAQSWWEEEGYDRFILWYELGVNYVAEAKIDPLLESQFAAGRLYASISSRPGQSGRGDGYVLEGKELEVSHRPFPLFIKSHHPWSSTSGKSRQGSRSTPMPNFTLSLLCVDYGSEKYDMP